MTNLLQTTDSTSNRLTKEYWRGKIKMPIMKNISVILLLVALSVTSISATSTQPNPYANIVFAVTTDEGNKLIDINQNLIKDIPYMICKSSKGGSLIVENNKDKYALLNKKGELISKWYDEIDEFSEGYSAVAIDNNYGYIDASGKEVIMPKFLKANHFTEGVAVVSTKDKNLWVIDKKGILKRISNLKSDYFVGYFSDGLAYYRNYNYGKFGYIDKNGNIVLKPIYDDAYPFSEGLASVNQNGKYKFIDKTGKVVLIPTMNAGGIFRNGITILTDSNNLSVIINKSGKILLKPKKYRLVDVYDNGLMRFDADKYVGYMNLSGKEITTEKYNYAGSLISGLAVVQMKYNGNAGMIDSTGKEVIPLKYSQIRNEKNQPIYVAVGGIRVGGDLYDATWGVLDRNGKQLMPLKYSNIVGIP